MGSNKEWQTGSFTYDPDAPTEWSYSDDIYTGTTVTSVTTGPFPTGDQFDHLIPNKSLLEKYPALKQAWEHYKVIENMCLAKEAENENRL